MTVKIICAVVIILSCSYVGIKMSGYLKKRVDTLTEMITAIGKIESCISTVRMPLEEIYSGLSKGEGVVAEFFSKVKVGNSWKYKLDILPGITTGDKRVLTDLSEKLGMYESERQLRELGLAKRLLADALEKAKRDVKTDSGIYRSMSFFTGVIVAILLI